MSKHVAILGAGPAGLAAALALRAVGCEVRVFERASADAQAPGVALTLWPNGLRALGAIEPSLPATLLSRGAATERVRFLDRQGVSLAEHSLEIAARYGAPCLNVRWSKLIESLQQHLPADCVRYEHEATDVTSDGQGGVRIAFGNGAQDSAAMCVIADGVHSRLRRVLLDDGQPLEHGRFIWRAVIPRPSEVRENEACFFAGEGQSATLLDVGGGEGFWSCALVTEERFEPLSLAETKALIHARFADFPNYFHCVVDAADSIVGRRLLDREIPASLAGHAVGPVVIIGDACHAMIPTIGQGANQSFEDACELAHAVATHSDLREALASYEQRRAPRVRIIRARAARLGHQVMHSSNADQLRDSLRGIAGHDVSLVEGDQADFDAWVYGYEPPVLGARA